MLAYNPNQVQPGWIAFFLVLALAIATFLLWRSMNTQLGRIKMKPRRAPRRPGERVDPADESVDRDDPEDTSPESRG